MRPAEAVLSKRPARPAGPEMDDVRPAEARGAVRRPCAEGDPRKRRNGEEESEDWMDEMFRSIDEEEQDGAQSDPLNRLGGQKRAPQGMDAIKVGATMKLTKALKSISMDILELQGHTGLDKEGRKFGLQVGAALDLSSGWVPSEEAAREGHEPHTEAQAGTHHWESDVCDILRAPPEERVVGGEAAEVDGSQDPFDVHVGAVQVAAQGGQVVHS